MFTNGVFDILHAGHVACLAEARRHGRSLVVGIKTDASARRLAKGPGRPLYNAVDRARVIGALASVTTVGLYDEDKPLALMRALQPDVYVKGGDCEAEHLPGRTHLGGAGLLGRCPRGRALAVRIPPMSDARRVPMSGWRRCGSSTGKGTVGSAGMRTQAAARRSAPP